MIFSDSTRTYNSHQTRKFSTFDFLDQSAWAICSMLRDHIEEWAKDFVGDYEFLGRYKSKDNKQHYSAEFELLMHTLLKKHKLTVEKHPDLGYPKKLDFRVKEALGLSTFLECTLAGNSFETNSESNLRSTVEEIIDEIEYHPYWINIYYNKLSQQSISKNKLLQFLEGVRISSNRIPDELLIDINHPYVDNGWELEFSMVRKANPTIKRSLGFMMNRAKTIETSKPLINSLNDKKPSRYGNLDAPYVICVNTDDQFSSENCFSEALFGQYGLDTLYTDFPFGNGYFLNKGSGYNTKVSAVLFFKYFNVYTLEHTQASLWHNPFAQFPVSENLLPFDQFIFNPNGNKIDKKVVRNGIPIIQLLGIDLEKYLHFKEAKPD